MVATAAKKKTKTRKSRAKQVKLPETDKIISVRVSDLQDLVAKAARLTPRRATNPAMGLVCITISATADSTSVMVDSLSTEAAYNAQREMGYMHPRDDDEPWTHSFCVEPIKFLGVLSGYSKSMDIDLYVEDDSNYITVSLEDSAYQLLVQNAKSFRQIRENFDPSKNADVESFVFNEAALGELIAKTAYSVSLDPLKAVLTCQHITIQTDGQTVESAATDGHRLSVAMVPDAIPGGESRDKERSFNLPAGVSALLKTMIFEKDGNTSTSNLKLWASMGSFTSTSTGDSLVFREIEGQYPNYRSLIPKQFSSTVELDGAAFVSKLSRIYNLSDDKESVFIVYPDSEEWIMSSRLVGREDHGGEMIDVYFSQEPPEHLDFSLKCRYALAAIEGAVKSSVSGAVRISYNSPTSPFVIEPITSDAGRENIHLLMPIQIRD